MTQNTQTTHFDLHITGFGFFNRIRKVEPKKGKPYWSTSIAAMRGDDGQKTYFDCSVVGAEAKALFDTHLSSVGENDVITASFKLGDLYTETFVYKQGVKSGQTGVSLKARLLQIRYLKINDQVVYQKTSSQQPEPIQNAA
ncbi:hypothetical protein C9J12_21285 [Photobacterium frigidiphilum]|uniref:DUF3577 domain-containing protein n=1 Tax=Photobacterium frigidiphilum TaxID=264736 RepID=A0A2T3JAA1_9GAMM|nr:DUF3577 domain-containing protein [Photobacterium frigidiphilum]PSU45776.1 hypothetical protein C9J12_21285 [Photobacterium frigidiphilum]